MREIFYGDERTYRIPLFMEHLHQVYLSNFETSPQSLKLDDLCIRKEIGNGFFRPNQEIGVEFTEANLVQEVHEGVAYPSCRLGLGKSSVALKTMGVCLQVSHEYAINGVGYAHDMIDKAYQIGKVHHNKMFNDAIECLLHDLTSRILQGD